MKIIGRDTAILMLDQKGNMFTGKMLYDNYEKDGSRGTIKGKEDNEIIKLWYDFDSEGMHSVMEVYFKKETGSFCVVLEIWMLKRHSLFYIGCKLFG
jgi:hypothetical protein